MILKMLFYHAHFNMQMKFVVESEEDYNKWIASQKTLKNTLTLK